MGQLRDTECRNAAPGKELHDGDNLVLRVGAERQNGDIRRTWTLVWRDGEGVRKARLAEYPDVGLAAARLLARDGMARIRQGLPPTVKAPKSTQKPAEPAQPAPPALTVGGLLKTYMLRHAIPNTKDPDQVQWVIDTPLKPLHDKAAAALTRADITQFLDETADKRGGPSAYRAGSVLRAAYRFALRRGDIEADPTHLLSLPAQNRPRERVLSDTEISAAWRTNIPVWSRLFRVLLLSGLRLREAAEAPAAEITGDVWSIPSNRMKAARAHIVPIGAELQAQIGDVNDLKWLFRSPRRFDQPVQGFGNGLSAVQEAAGIADDWTWHDTRRTIASGLQRMGAPSEVIESILAHRRPGVASVYQRHEYVAERRLWLGLWADHCRSVSLKDTTET